jgi:hypothetical protein
MLSILTLFICIFTLPFMLNTCISSSPLPFFYFFFFPLLSFSFTTFYYFFSSLLPYPLTIISFDIECLYTCAFPSFIIYTTIFPPFTYISPFLLLLLAFTPFFFYFYTPLTPLFSSWYLITLYPYGSTTS